MEHIQTLGFRTLQFMKWVLSIQQVEWSEVKW
jgi:hypothetical protein